MSFILLLEVDELTESQGRAIETECRERGAWPVRFVPRRSGFARLVPWSVEGPALFLPDQVEGRDLLTEEAEWGAPAWAMEPDLLPPLAEAMRIIADELPQGFAFRATWDGSEVRDDRVVAADDFASIVLASNLNEFTRYRVPPSSDRYK